MRTCGGGGTSGSMKNSPPISGAEHSPRSGRQISRVLVNRVGNDAASAPRAEALTNRQSNERQQQQQLHDNPAHRQDQGRRTQAQPPPPPPPPLENYDGDHETTDGGLLHEVYLFECCGLTRELKPAHEYAATFGRLFHAFNGLVFLFGLATLGMGLWFRIDPKVYEIHKYIETQNFTIAGWILLLGGFLACLLALVGLLAALRGSISLLLCYLLATTVLGIAFVSAIIMLTIYGLGLELESFLIKELYEQVRRRTMNTETDLFASNEAIQFLDFVQVKMRCCGAADFRDYQKMGMVIPTTCYAIAGNYVNAPGCGRAIRKLMDIRAGMATGFATGGVIAQLLASLTCCLMICSIYSWRATPTRSSPPQPAES